MTPRCLAVWLLLALSCAPAAPPTPAPAASTAAPAASAYAAPAARWLDSEVRFASRERAREVLGRPDAFVRAHSVLDRQLRARTPEALDEARFLAFAAEQALGWSADEERALAPALAVVGQALAGLSLPLPPVVWLVKSSGAEEFGAPYTRGDAIVLPRAVVDKDRATSGLLAHELWHVATRHQPALRDRLYPLLGFERVAPVAYPPALEGGRITNPDAFGLEHAIEVTVEGGRRARVVPIIQCRVPLNEALAAPSVLQLIRIELVETAESGEPGRVHAVEATDFLAWASINTEYAIHPEEVLADNFALLLARRAGKSPKVQSSDVLDALEAGLRAPP